MTPLDPSVLRAVHRFWFGELRGPDDYPADKAPIWFRTDPETDALIEREFGAYLDPAADPAFDPSGLAREEVVGLVVLLDQFPRNIFRQSAQAFAYDPAARRYAEWALAKGPAQYHLIERAFLGLPFEHSEDAADQERAMDIFTAIRDEAPEAQRETYGKILDFAVKHRDLIARFGRFPHRNAVLGRASTPEEEAFLKEFGRGY